MHEVVLREFRFYQRIFDGIWKVKSQRSLSSHLHSANVTQEAQSRELVLVEDDVVLVKAMLMHIYGADKEIVLDFARKLSEELNDVVKDDVENLTELQYCIAGNSLCSSEVDPEPWHSRVASEVSVHPIRLYSLADKYDIACLKEMLWSLLKGLINTAWNHSEILHVIDLIVTSIPETDQLHSHILQAIDSRLDMLAMEWQFIEYIKTMPELCLIVGDMTMKMVASSRSQEKVRRHYCAYSKDE